MCRADLTRWQKEVKVAAGVTSEEVISACEEASELAGFAVVSRTDKHLVLLPLPETSPLKCTRYSLFGRSQPIQENPALGHAVCAEVVASQSREGRPSMAMTITADECTNAKTLLHELRHRLKVYAHRARVSGAAEKMSCANVGVWPKESGLAREGDQQRTRLSAYYILSRLLCNQQEGIVGVHAAELIRNLSGCDAEASKNDGTAQDQNRIAQILDASQELVTLVQNALCAPQTTDETLARTTLLATDMIDREHFLKVCVERHLFSRLGCDVWHLYSSKCEDTDSAYVAKVKALRSVTDTEILSELGAKDVFVHNPTKECGMFQRAIKSLSKVETLLASGVGSIPREAVDALAIANCEMKACAMELSHGSVALSSMDDILPIFIFILVRSSIVHPAACWTLLSDSLTADQKLGEEGKLLTVFESAAGYVSTAWDIHNLVDDEGNPAVH